MNLVVILVFFVKLSTSENIDLIFDVNFPIIIADKFMNDSNFGSTVSLTDNKLTKSDSPSGWLFIGAPTSGSTTENSGSDDECYKPEKPGVLWRCSLGRIAGEDNCEIVQLELDEDINLPGKGKPSKECREDNLLGFSLTSDNERLVTCSPKWSRGNDYMNGICYWLDKDTYTKDVKSVVNKNTYEHRLIPFFIEVGKNDKYQYMNLDKTKNGGQDWVLGQAGMSAHTTYVTIGGERVERLLIGAPGVRLWSGAIAIYTDNDNPTKGERTRKNRNGNKSFSEYIVLHRGKVGEKSSLSEENYLFEYFGYAVTSGKLGSRNFYVGGSPRGYDLMGEAVVFEYPDDQELKNPNLRFQIKEKDIISTIKPKEGSFGSYFGSVLHTMDIFENGRAVDEIFVGAPLFGISNKERRRRDIHDSEKMKNHSRLFGDHGAVFIFQYDSEMREFKQLPQILHGDAIPGARFGSAISSVTKISANYQIKQLVVGAPYENCEFKQQSSCGAVYIYEPVKDEPKVEFKYKIDPSKWNHPIRLRGFGSSLSLGMDIDFNETPDLAIGAYKSQKVIVLRSRLPFKLKGTIRFLDMTGNQIVKFSKKSEGLTVQSCILIEPYEDLGDLAEQLDINTRLSIDRNFDRFVIQNRNSDSVFTAPVETKKSKCTNFTLKPNKTYFNDDSQVNPPAIEVIQELSYNIPNSEMRPRQLDIADGQGRKFLSTPIIEFNEFQKELPFSTTVESKSSLPITECLSDKCKPNIILSADWFHSSGNTPSNPITEYTIGSTVDLVLQITINNTGETAFGPKLTVNWERGGVETKDRSSECTKQDTKSETERGVDCKYNIIGGQKKKTVTLKFDMRYLFAKREAEENKFVVNMAVIEGDKKYLATLSANLSLLVDASVTITGSRDYLTLATPFPFTTTHIRFDGRKSGERKVELYNSVPHKFEVHLSGKSPLESFKTVFEIPVRKKGSTSMDQIILVRVPFQRQSSKSAYHLGNSCETDGIYNFFQIDRYEERSPVDSVTENPTTEPHNGGNEIGSRKKRSIDKTVGPKRSKNNPEIKKKDNMNYLNCDDFECMKITCTVTRKNKAHKSTYREIFPIIFELYLVQNLTDELIKTTQKDAILIEARGKAQIFSTGHQNYQIDQDVSQTLLSKMAGKVPPWVYPVGALIALILLAIIVLILYKLGFFKREKHEKLIVEKAEERRKSMMVPRHSSAGVTYDTFGSSQDDLLLNDDNVEADEQAQEAKDTDKDNSNQ